MNYLVDGRNSEMQSNRASTRVNPVDRGLGAVSFPPGQCCCAIEKSMREEGDGSIRRRHQEKTLKRPKTGRKVCHVGELYRPLGKHGPSGSNPLKRAEDLLGHLGRKRGRQGESSCPSLGTFSPCSNPMSGCARSGPKGGTWTNRHRVCGAKRQSRRNGRGAACRGWEPGANLEDESGRCTRGEDAGGEENPMRGGSALKGNYAFGSTEAMDGEISPTQGAPADTGETLKEYVRRER